MTRRRLSLVLSLLMAVLSACSTAPIATPTATVHPENQVTITFWHPWHDEEARLLSALALEYQRDHPEVIVQLEEQPLALLRDRYDGAVRDGTAPDVLLLGYNRWIGHLASRERLLPLGDLAGPELEEQLSLALPGTRYAGKLYGLPISYHLPVLFYNQSHMKEEEPATTAELLSRAEFFSRDHGYGLAYNLTLDFTLPYLEGFGGRIFDENGRVVLGTDGAAGTQAWLEWLRMLRSHSREGKILAIEDKDQIDRAVLGGDASVMVVDWSSTQSKYREVWGAAVRVASLPKLSLPNQDPQAISSAISSEVLVLNPHSPEQEQRAALGLIKWLASPDPQRRLLELPSKQPVNKAVNLEGDPFRLRLHEIAVSSRPAPAPTPALETSWKMLRDLVRRVLENDNLPVDEAVAETATQICAALAQPC